MTKGWALLLGFLLFLSLKDVYTRSNEPEEDDDFQAEFDGVGASAQKSQQAGRQQQATQKQGGLDFGDDETENSESETLEIREPTGFSRPNQPGVGGGKQSGADLPPVRALYCVSCGFRQAFDHLSQHLHERWPGLHIEGANYPPAAWKALVAQALSFAKIGLIFAIVTGKNPFLLLGWAEPPAIIQWAHANKLSACMMSFMLSNMVEGMLMSTGAFEVYVGEQMVWSKLEAGRFPSPAELAQAIESQFELLGKAVGASSSGFGAAGKAGAAAAAAAHQEL